MKEFSNVRIEHVESLSWWFWTRESFAALNTGVREVFIYPYMANNIREWMLVLVLIPMGYLACFNYAAFLRRRYVTSCIKGKHPFLIYNKNNIAYFTILETLCGGPNDGCES